MNRRPESPDDGRAPEGRSPPGSWSWTWTWTWTWIVLPLVIAVGCAVLAFAAAADPALHASLDYRRDAIAAGQLWRLATAHAMHLSSTHATLDIAALLVIAWIFGPTMEPRLQAATLVAGAAAVDAALWFLHPEVERYVGLSGVLHALFAAGASRWLLARRTGPQRSKAVDAAFDAERSGMATAGTDAARPAQLPIGDGRRLWGAALAIGLVAKLAIEARATAFWLPEPFEVVTAAHRWGAAAGALCGAAATLVGDTLRRRRADAAPGRRRGDARAGGRGGSRRRPP